MRASFLSSSVLLAACTVANPAYETGDTAAADTVAGQTTGGVDPTAGTDTQAPPPTTGVEGTTTAGPDGSTGPVLDTGVASSDTGIETCLPTDPGRALNVRVFNTFTETCAGPEIAASVVDLARIPGTDHFSGRLCPLGCAGICPKASDDGLRIEMPTDLAMALDQATCIDLNARVDHEDECLVDHFAMWIAGQDGKTPELVGATNEADPRLIGSAVLPDYVWSEVQNCGEQCPDFNKYPGTWKIEFVGGTGLDHNTDAASVPLTWIGGNTSLYHVRNLQSFVGEDCLGRMAWVAEKEL